MLGPLKDQAQGEGDLLPQETQKIRGNTTDSRPENINALKVGNTGANPFESVSPYGKSLLINLFLLTLNQTNLISVKLAHLFYTSLGT